MSSFSKCFKLYWNDRGAGKFEIFTEDALVDTTRRYTTCNTNYSMIEHKESVSVSAVEVDGHGPVVNDFNVHHCGKASILNFLW